MPIQTCTLDGKPGFKWGDSGKCYTYDPNNDKSRSSARAQAAQQALGGPDHAGAAGSACSAKPPCRVWQAGSCARQQCRFRHYYTPE